MLQLLYNSFSGLIHQYEYTCNNFGVDLEFGGNVNTKYGGFETHKYITIQGKTKYDSIFKKDSIFCDKFKTYNYILKY